MSFFKQLQSTGIKNVVIEVKTTFSDEITVFITPKTSANDPALKTFKPIFLTGTPEEIDAVFFEKVSEPLSKTQGTFDNIEAFEAQKAEAEKSNAIAKAEKDKKEAAEKEKKEKVTKAVDNLKKIVDAEDYDAIKEKDKVLKAIEKVVEVDADNAYAAKVKKELLAKTDTGLFNEL